MNKKIIYLTIALTLSSLMLPSLSQGLSTANYAIVSSGTIVPAPPITSMKLENAIVIYGRTSLNASEIAYVANNFDLIVTEFWEQGAIALNPSTIQSIKTLNPNMLIFGYFDLTHVNPLQYLVWTTVNSHEDYFLHDINANRIYDTAWNTLLMDPSSSGWRQYYTSWVNDRLSDPNNSLYAGVFSDDVWGYLSLQISYGKFTATIPSGAVSNWHTDIVNFLHYVKDNIVSGKKVLINTEEFISHTHDYIDVVDGMMAEAIYHANWLPLSDMYDNIPYYTNDISIASATGKIFVSLNGESATKC